MRPGLPDRSVPFYNLILRLDHWQRRAPVLPEGFRLRFYQPGDEAAWAALEYGIGDFDPQEEARAYFVQTYGSHAQDLARRCLFAVDGGGRVAGTCCAWRDPRGGGEVASLHWLAVSPEAQGRGLGKALCREALAVFQDLGEFPVYIHTQPWSWKALLLYVREGFKIQRTDSFAAYENQYQQGMETLRDLLPRDLYAELFRCSQD